MTSTNVFAKAIYDSPTLEQFKEITGHPGIFIGDRGTVLTTRARKCQRDDPYSVDAHVWKPSISGSGYYFIRVRTAEGKELSLYVHRLVADYFIPNDDPEHKTEVNHINEVKTDNTKENLEHCTHLYNMQYGTRTQRMIDTMIAKGIFTGDPDHGKKRARAYYQANKEKLLQYHRHYGKKYYADHQEEIKADKRKYMARPFTDGVEVITYNALIQRVRDGKTTKDKWHLVE